MSNKISLLKARYCLSILGTSTLATDAEARHLIEGLKTEVATPDTSQSISAAELAALAAIKVLADHLQGRSVAFASTEWSKAQQSIESWVQTAS